MVHMIHKGILALALTFLISFSSIAQSSTAEKAKAAHDKANYKEAIKLYSKLIESNNATFMDHYYRGNAYLNSSMAQQAYEDFSTAIKLAPDFAEAYFMRGTMLINPNQVQDAINDLNMAVKYARNDTIKTISLANRASAKLTVNNIEGALKDCKESLKIDSTSSRSFFALVNLSSCYGHQKKFDLSIPILKKIYMSDSMDIRVIGNLGYEYSQNENYEQSIYYFNRVLKIAPKSAFTMSNKAFSLLKLGKAAEALPLINRSIELAPTNSYAFMNLGLIYLELKEKDKACESFRVALKKGFKDMYGDEVNDLLKTHCN